MRVAFSEFVIWLNAGDGIVLREAGGRQNHEDMRCCAQDDARGGGKKKRPLDRHEPHSRRSMVGSSSASRLRPAAPGRS